eukprot:CAMPEP_0198601120 /NCGR_PEP_ID=MMETSP1462-20131121/149119_1 /TAXON_ID=1333877 /ORGANISM="Brandtodinium nutriculum, Strain RCC3387" /LENGTH=127 /DNA_ID=CAMNT_0044332843 /DNA_START=35 /DNA_END=414 /DNA_ORIENTATION=-
MAVAEAMDPPSVLAMEACFITTKSQQLDERLRFLERLAQAAAAASGTSADPGGAPWRPGGRDFTQAFLADSVAGFHVDKARIAQRERYLATTAHDASLYQSFIGWLAGVPSDRAAVRERALDRQTWR